MSPTVAVVIASFATVSTFALFTIASAAYEAKAKFISLGAALLTGTLAVGMGLSAFYVVTEADETWQESETTKIASMASASEVDGKSGVFVTRIEEKNVLRYVESHSDGSYSLEEVDADGARIREDSDADSARLAYEECTRDGIEGFLSSCGVRYVFHVPKGTVSNDFSVDPGAN